WVIPRLWNRRLAYPDWPAIHFWLATIGIVLYTVSMWAAGLTEGLEWRAFDDAGQLRYPNFVDIVHQLAPFYWLRLVGGLLYFTGAIMLAVNFFKTIAGRSVQPATEAPAAAGAEGGAGS
ncbi:MAG TPA: cbb3-type cytochrome c oxidase subunit I, partial [Gemmatimonadales bacterium]